MAHLLPFGLGVSGCGGVSVVSIKCGDDLDNSPTGEEVVIRRECCYLICWFWGVALGCVLSCYSSLLFLMCLNGLFFRALPSLFLFYIMFGRLWSWFCVDFVNIFAWTHHSFLFFRYVTILKPGFWNHEFHCKFEHCYCSIQLCGSCCSSVSDFKASHFIPCLV